MARYASDNRLYVGGDLYVKDDVVYDEVTGRNINITGIATVGSTLRVGSATSQLSVLSTGPSIKVGIGTTVPGFTLDVRGDTNVEGKLMVNEIEVPSSIAMVIALGGF